MLSEPTNIHRPPAGFFYQCENGPWKLFLKIENQKQQENDIFNQQMTQAYLTVSFTD